MTITRRGQVVIGVLLVAILSFLYVKTRAADFGEHADIVAGLRQLKQVDATLNQAVILSRLGLLTHYDPLVTSMADLNALRQRLSAGPLGTYGQEHADIARALAGVTEALAVKDSLVERFKSENAVLRNSLVYFPIVSSEVAQTAVRVPAGAQLADSVNTLLRETLIYNLTATEERRSKIRALLDGLGRARGPHPRPIADLLPLALAHGEIILAQRVAVDNVLAEIVSLPTADRADELLHAHEAVWERLVHRTNLYRLYLYIFAILLLAGIGYAILQLRRTAATLARVNVELRTEVLERQEAEAALGRSEERLRQAQKMEAIGQLAGGVAHDFNNHLAVILGGLEILAERIEPTQPDLLPTLTQINRAAERSAELTQRLLAFGRRQALQPKVLDVNQLVHNMGSLLRRTLGETIDLDVVRAGGLWKTEADPGQIESALLNLAINARDAMPRGGKLTIETGNALLDDQYASLNEDVTAGQYVMLAVSDTGLGMSPEVRESAFEPFFTTKGPAKGTGLGLSMVYGFVKQSGGHMKIYSEVGQGTTVRLYFPRARRDQEVSERPVAAAGVLGGKETILIVEDHPDVRATVVAQLGRMGYRLFEAANAADALALLERPEPVDLLFTDVVLPGGMSGRELAEVVRRRWPNLKVLLTSGYTPNASVHQGRLDEGVDLLTKPYRRADLAHKVRQVLDRE